MVTVRTATPEDAAAIAAIRAESWQSAYAGIIAADLLARFTSQEAIEQRIDAMRRKWPPGMLLAEAEAGFEAESEAESGSGFVRSGGAAGPGVVPRPGGVVDPLPVGFAHFGAERDPESRMPLLADQVAGRTRAELYAIYVLPGYWSAGAGRALMAEVIYRTRAAGYPALTLWVLQDNDRARRFYERAGFRVTGQSLALDWLGGITEVEYARELG
ncbi:MAG: GNAT family N-acetyltransferase [Streptosporangiaceae bacterium]